MRLLQSRKAAEDRVFIVEPRRGIGGDEELGSIRVRTCVCHAHGIQTDRASNRPKTCGPRCSSHLPLPSELPVWIMNSGITR